MMNRKFKALVLPLCVSASLVLVSCAGGDTKPLTDMSFAHLQPYPLYVASYEVFTTPASDGIKIPEGFVANPVIIAQDYFKNRFHETGSNGKLSVVVDNATVKHSVQQSESKVGAFMGVDKYDAYEISLVVKLIVFEVNGYEKQENTIRVQRSVSISEHVSLAERERLQMEAMDKIMDDIDVGVKNILGQDLKILH